MSRSRPYRIIYMLLTLGGLAAPIHAAGVTLEPAKDNTLYESATGALSSGVGPHLLAGRTGQAQLSRRRGLTAFDLAAAVPAGATIDVVTLSLNVSQTGAGPKSVGLHRALTDWGEGASDATDSPGGGAPAEPGDATWIHAFSPSTLWNSSGGDFVVAPSATTLVGGLGSYSWSSPEMVADVQAWLDQPATNFGWVLVGDESTSGTSKRFDSRDNPDASVRPLLTVEYSIPAVPSDSSVGRVVLGILFAAGLGLAIRRRTAISAS